MAANAFTEAVKRWENSVYEVEHLKKKLREAISQKKVHASFLGKLIAPSNIVIGEKICVWVRINSEQERLVESTCTAIGSYTLNFRGESKDIDEVP